MPTPPDAPDVAYDVFISYSSKDAGWVRGDLLARLEAEGFRVCIDFRDFTPGAASVAEMERAVLNSRHTLLVLTPNYLLSDWTTFETYLLQTLDPANQQRRLIPLLKQPCEIPLRLRIFTNVDFTDPHKQEFAWSRLIQALGTPSNASPLDKLDLGAIPDVGALPPTSRMPLSRNPLFVGREDDLRALAGMLKAGGTAAIGQIAAATGLGGIGKTQLAAEFVHRYGQFFAGGVCWLSFADPAVVPSEVAACGGASGMDLGAEFESQPIDRQVQIVLTKWESNLPRLLIFDNCEDESLLDEWRPKHGGCRVIVTSRRQQWSAALGVQSLHIEVLPRPESIALLRKFRPDLAEDDADLNAIAEELGDLPLALHLAGSFLAKYRHAITPAQYLERLRKPTILDDRSLRAADISPTKHIQHVARTFEQSYERLDPSDPTDSLAIKLLARAAHFAPGEPLPRWLLVQTLDLPEDDPDAVLQAEDALSRLIDLGMLETEDEGWLRMHRLLAVFVRTVVKDAEVQTVVEETLFDVAAFFNRKGDPRPVLVLQSHLRFITDRAQQRDDELVARLNNEFGYHLKMIGDYAGVRKYYERALSILERVQGEENTYTTTSLNNLGRLLHDQGDLIGAREYHERALLIMERVLGKEHADTASGLNSLGAVLQDQGDLSGAREYYEQALAIRERVLGQEHPDKATSLNNLGSVLQAQGDLVGAQQYYERALAIREHVLGQEHPDTASSLNNLGVVLQDQGDLSGAREYYEQALATWERVLGQEHPNAASGLNNLGSVLQAQGDLVGAQQYHERALAIRERVLGIDHPDTAQSLNNLGSVLDAQGDLAGARGYYERALLIFEKCFGSDHPNMQVVRRNLASLDAELQTIEQQVAEIVQQAETAVEQALASGNSEDKATLEAEIEKRAQWAEEGEEDGSPYLVLAAQLRALAVRLRGE